jgi:hypothetical protein
MYLAINQLTAGLGFGGCVAVGRRDEDVCKIEINILTHTNNILTMDELVVPIEDVEDVDEDSVVTCFLK